MNIKTIAKRNKTSQSNISMLLNGTGKNVRKTMNIKLANDLSKLSGKPYTDFLSPKALSIMKSKLWQTKKAGNG